MKKINVISAVLVVMTATIFGQTVQEKKQMSVLETEIMKTREEVAYLERDLEFDLSPAIDTLKGQISSLYDRIKSEQDSTVIEALKDSLSLKKKEVQRLSKKTISVDRGEAQSDIATKKAKIAGLERERETIFLKYATSVNVPKELSARELRRRERTNVLRREDMVISKIEANIASTSTSATSMSVDPASTPATQAGYKIILVNDHVLPTNFIISPVNGGEGKGVLLGSLKKSITYLIPGRYLVTFQQSGETKGLPQILNVTGEVKIINGESCFGYAYMSRF